MRERANAYVAAGADAIFPEALQTKDEFRDFAKEVKAPLLANMTEFGKSPLTWAPKSCLTGPAPAQPPCLACNTCKMRRPGGKPGLAFVRLKLNLGQRHFRH